MGHKVALVAFSGDPICFIHVLLNAADMRGKGYDVKIVLEGESTKLIPRFAEKNEPFRNLFMDIVNRGMIDCACKACSNKMGTLQVAQGLKIDIRGEMSGHPSLARLKDEGYEIITF